MINGLYYWRTKNILKTLMKRQGELEIRERTEFVLAISFLKQMRILS